jgi:hypothetical protein
MKYVFIDMDGVIAEYGYPSGLYDGEFRKGNYVGKKPVISVMDEIIKKYNNPDYILMICSASPNAKATLEKQDWLNMHFSLPYENRIFISPDDDKVEVIRYYIEDLMHGNVQEHAIIIDDKGSILAKAHSLGIECYHPTQLLAMKKDETPVEEAAPEEQPVEQPVEQTEEVVETPIEETPVEEVVEKEPEIISNPNIEVIEETEEVNPDEEVDIEVSEQMTIEDLQEMLRAQGGII